MEANPQAEFSFFIPQSRFNNPDYLERLSRIMEDMQARPGCNIQLLQMVQITGEPDRVEQARSLMYRFLINSNLNSNQDERATGA